MIDVKELRLNNIIGYYEKHLKINHIDDEYVGDNNGILDKHEYFDPIPLTPEILVKCGFVRTVQTIAGWSGKPFEYIDYRINNFACIQVKDTFEVEFAQSFVNVSDRSHICTIQYLHQLQNMYYCLCGVELIISL